MSDGNEKVEVPIVQEEFANFLRKYKVYKGGEMCDTIAENIGETGGADVFEDPEALAKGLGSWSEYIGAPLRKQILGHWFAKKHIDVSPEVLETAGITPRTEAAVKKKKEAEKKVAEGNLWTVDVDDKGMPKIRMIKGADEPGTTLAEATRAAKEIAKEYGGEESLVTYSESVGRHMPNFKSDFVKKNLGVAWAAARQMDQAMAEGTPIDPMDVWIEQAAKMQSMREIMGAGQPEPKGTLTDAVAAIKELREMAAAEGKLPDWLRDPLAFQQTIQTLIPSGDSEALKEVRDELARVRDDLHESELRHKDEQIEALANAIHGYKDEVSALKVEVERNRDLTGRTAYDLLGQAIEKIDHKVPDKADIRQMVTEIVSKGPKLVPRGPKERETALEGMAAGIEQAAEVKAIEDKWWALG